MDGVVGWQIAQREARGVVLHCQALTHGGVVASAAARRGVAVAQGHWVGVAARQVERQTLPLQGQLPGLDVCGHQASQRTHGLWEARRTFQKVSLTIEKANKIPVLNVLKSNYNTGCFDVKSLISVP